LRVLFPFLYVVSRRTLLMYLFVWFCFSLPYLTCTYLPFSLLIPGVLLNGRAWVLCFPAHMGFTICTQGISWTIKRSISLSDAKIVINNDLLLATFIDAALSWYMPCSRVPSACCSGMLDPCMCGARCNMGIWAGCGCMGLSLRTCYSDARWCNGVGSSGHRWVADSCRRV
jgi:hypothetical protein